MHMTHTRRPSERIGLLDFYETSAREPTKADLMAPSDPERYCRCGTRLAHDNGGALCGPCCSASRGLASGAPEVPPEVWHTDQIRDALRARHMGRLVRAYRLHTWHGETLPQGVVGA